MRYENAVIYGLLSAIAMIIPFIGEFLSFYFLIKFALTYANTDEFYIGFAIAIFATFLVSIINQNAIVTMYFFTLQNLCCVFLTIFHKNIEKHNQKWWCPENICVDKFIKLSTFILVIILLSIQNIDLVKNTYFNFVQDVFVLLTSVFKKIQMTETQLHNTFIGRLFFVVIAAIFIKTFVFYKIFQKYKQTLVREKFELSNIYSNQAISLSVLMLYIVSAFFTTNFYIENIKIFSIIAPLIYGLSVFHFIATKINSNIFLFFIYIFTFNVPYFVYVVAGLGIIDSVINLRIKFDNTFQQLKK